MLRGALKHAYIATFFGYSAPTSDLEAVELMKTAWGDPSSRELEEIEIIDVKTDDELHNTWQSFIHSHHYRVTNEFSQSLLGQHPRRTCEALWMQLMMVQWNISNEVPHPAGWDEMIRFYEVLKSDEDTYNANNVPKGKT